MVGVNWLFLPTTKKHFSKEVHVCSVAHLYIVGFMVLFISLYFSPWKTFQKGSLTLISRVPSQKLCLNFRWDSFFLRTEILVTDLCFVVVHKDLLLHICIHLWNSLHIGRAILLWIHDNKCQKVSCKSGWHQKHFALVLDRFRPHIGQHWHS